MENPYQNLPGEAFWRSAIAEKSLADIGPVWNPKFELTPEHKVATFGSCFAQHIGAALSRRGHKWLSTEPPPGMISAANARRFNYDIYTCRTGNIYTTSLLSQWTDWALGDAKPPPEIWSREGRYYDPFRPAIEPNGFASGTELVACRAKTIKCFRDAITEADIFVFTLGLTESWKHQAGGYEYPMCPGTLEGSFDPGQHVFENQLFGQVLTSLLGAIKKMLTLNKHLKFILTVSPVPLTATNSGNHVLVAATESKSILRAVAGQLARHWRNVDYFPSYELITSQASRGVFYEPNQRSVTQTGVDFVMDRLFGCLARKFGDAPASAPPPARSNAELVCEEELLQAFSGRP